VNDSELRPPAVSTIPPTVRKGRSTNPTVDNGARRASLNPGPLQIPTPLEQDPEPKQVPPPPTPLPEVQSQPETRTKAGPDPKISVGADGRITLHMDDLDIRRALEVLSRQSGLNIMLSPGVSGRVTANLEGATVNQALMAILKLGNLTARREDGMIYVYSSQDFEQVAFQNQEILTRVYRLNYIRAADLIQMIQELLSPKGTISATPPSREGINDSPGFVSTGSPGGSGGGGGGGGGAGGGIGTSGGNSMAGGDVVIVRDYFANLKAIDEIVKKLDVQPSQVLVEAVIMSVELTETSQLGVNYAVVDNLGRTLGTIGNGSDLVNNSGFDPASLLTVPVTTAGAVGTATTATAAALAAAGRINGGTGPGGLSSTTNGIKFGFVSKNNSGFIRALENLGDTKVLASPRLLVLNKQKAEIQLGQRLGYQTITQNLTSTVQQVNFLNTGTLLRLRPFISTDGMVRMEIHPERSSGAVTNNLPSSNTSEVTTNVMVPDGATIIIGGLIENTQDYSQTGPPGLHRIPLLGAIFGDKTKDRAKRELIILLTPHIWKQGPVADACPTPPPGGTAARSSGDPLVLQTSMSVKVPPRPADPSQASSSREAAPGKTRHVVLAGENFWTISRRYYRTGRYYLALWDANRDLAATPEQLSVGDEIRVPPLAELDRSLEVDPRTNKLMDGTSVSVAVASTSRRRSVGMTEPNPTRARSDPASKPESAPARRSRISGN
jgi:general secretion pathway protein D